MHTEKKTDISWDCLGSELEYSQRFHFPKNCGQFIKFWIHPMVGSAQVLHIDQTDQFIFDYREGKITPPQLC